MQAQVLYRNIIMKHMDEKFRQLTSYRQASNMQVIISILVVNLI